MNGTTSVCAGAAVTAKPSNEAMIAADTVPRMMRTFRNKTHA